MLILMSSIVLESGPCLNYTLCTLGDRLDYLSNKHVRVNQVKIRALELV